MIKIIKAKRKDAQAALDIRRKSILDKCISHYSPEQLEHWAKRSLSEKFIDHVEKQFYLATVDGVIAATGMLTVEIGRIDAIFVDPKYMGLGLATAMMAHLEDLAMRSGLERIKLDSTLNAAPFYRKCGFNGDEISTYTSPKGISLDCIPMCKCLADN